MSRLPAIRPDVLIAALRKIGYVVDHQTGSHIILYKPGRLPISVPRHNRELKRGTLHQILHNAGISVDDLIALLR